MGKLQWVSWSVYVALLINVASTSGLGPSTPADSVCEMQVAITHALATSPSRKDAPGLTELQRQVDSASGVPASTTQFSVPPGMAVLSVLRAPELAQPSPAHFTRTIDLVSPQERTEIGAVPVDTGETSRPPDNRYRFLLTPHAPPERV